MSDPRSDRADLVERSGGGFRAGLQNTVVVAGPDLGADAPVVGGESGEQLKVFREGVDPELLQSGGEGVEAVAGDAS